MSRFQVLARVAFGLFWALHGVVHVIGFAGSWRLATYSANPYTTSLLDGQIEVGDAGMRVVGLAWLLLIPLFLAAAVSIVRNRRRALTLTAVSAAASLVVCAFGLPAAIVGLVIDAAALIGILLVGLRSTVAQPHLAAR